MKKTISILLCLLLIFSSVSSVFASATSWDTTDQANLQTIKNQLSNTSGGSIYYMISQINGAMRFTNKTIANWLADIEGHLASALYYEDGGNSRSITWWIKEAVLDLDQMVGTGSGTMLYYLNLINTRAGYINTNLTTANGHLTNIYDKTDAIRQIVLISQELLDDIAGYQVGILGHQNNIDTLLNTSATWNWNSWTSTLTNNNEVTSYSRTSDPLNQAIYGLQFVSRNVVYGFTKMFNQAFTGYNSQQTAKNWLTLQSSNFTPTSQTNGIYTWLANIQEPIARLSYVHASDEEIAAREKAAANQDAVVDNFIDSSGSGAAPASSFGDVASMSAGYTTNMSTDASASGIWNIFSSNNFGWFSQETANQLDTTVSTRKGSSDFETPLLDQQIADIYKELGVDVND